MQKLMLGLIATVLFGFIGNANNLSEIEKPTRIKHLDPKYDAVSDLILASLNTWSINPYESFFDSEISTLFENKNRTVAETDRMLFLGNEAVQKMLDSNNNLKMAYNKVESLAMSDADFRKNVDKFFVNNPINTLSYNRALIPNKKACNNSRIAIAMASFSVVNPGFLLGYLGYIGQAVHC